MLSVALILIIQLNESYQYSCGSAMVTRVSSATIPFFLRVLHPPAYGFEKNGELVKPTVSEILREFFSRLNIFKTRKAWLSLLSWTAVVVLVVPFVLFFTQYFTRAANFRRKEADMDRHCSGSSGCPFQRRW